MKHNNATGYVLAGFAVLGLAACSSQPATDVDTAPATSTASPAADAARGIDQTCTSVQDEITILDQLRWTTDRSMGAPISDEERGYNACDRYRSGDALVGLRSASVEWDQVCLSNVGWALTDNRTPVRVSAPADGDSTYYPAQVAQCAAPTIPAEACEQVRRALDPGPALRYEDAAVLTALGCTNTELRLSTP